MYTTGKLVFSLMTGLALCSCGKSQPAPAALEVERQAEPLVSQLLSDWQAPDTLEEAVADKLLRELSRVLAEQGITRMTSAPPSGPAGAVADLTLNGDSFSWSLRNQGDYDQNGEVNVSDITPIGIYLGRTSADPDWFKAQLADGDGNGAVTIADITPIGINFGNLLDGYELQFSLDGQGDWTRRTELPLAAAILPPGGGVKYFDLLQPGAPIGFYRVAAYEHDPPSRELGAVSNVVERQPSGGPVSPGNWNGSGADPQNTGYSVVPGPDSILSVGDLNFSYRYGQPLIGNDDRIYTAGADGIIACLTADLTRIWGLDISGWPLIHRLADDNTSYVATLDGRIIRINAAGSEDWTKFIPDEILDIRAVDDGGLLYVDGADSLHRLDSAGTELWSYAAAGRSFGLCMPISGGIFCVTTWTGQPYLGQLPTPSDVVIQAVDDTGSFQWSLNVGGLVPQQTDYFYNESYLGRDSDGNLLVSTTMLAAFDSTGSLAWEGPVEQISGLVKSASGENCYTTFGNVPDRARCQANDIVPGPSLETAANPYSPALGRDGSLSWQTIDDVLQSYTPGPTFFPRWEYTGLDTILDGVGDLAGNYFGYWNGSLISIDASGNFRWGEGGGGFPNGGFSFAADGRVISGFGGLSVLQYDESFGTVYPCWRANAGTPWILPDDRIAFTGTFEGRPAILCCADNGALIWKHLPLGRIVTRLAMGGSGQLYYGWTDNSSDYISCLSTEGSLLWSYELSGAQFNTLGDPLSMALNNLDSPELLYARADDRLLAVNGNGEFQWEFVFGSPPASTYSSGVSVQPDGAAVFDDWSGNMRAINPDGSSKWIYNIGGSLYSGDQAVAPDGSVAFGSSDSHFYVLNEDGSQRWTKPFPSSVFSPVCLDSAGRFYFSNANNASVISSVTVEGGRTFCLDTNGDEVWSWGNEPAWYSRPCIDGSGRLYIMQKDGTAVILAAIP